MSKLKCKDCGTELLKLRPPLSERKVEGRPMTLAEAKFLFVDSRGGRCICCFIEKRNRDVSELMRRKSETTKPITV